MRNWQILVGGLCLCGASKQIEAPPLAQCGEQGCHPILGGAQHGASTGGTNGGVGDAGDGVSLTVQAVEFVNSGARSWALSSTREIIESITARAPASDGSIATSTGASPVTLTKVHTGSFAWVSASPTAAGSTYMPSLVSIANWGTTTVHVPLFPRAEFSFVAGLFTQTTLTLDSTRAQLALKIVDPDGNGVRNARIANPGGAALAYANAGTWIDASLDPYTDDSGRVVVINLPAPGAPGTFATLTAYGNDSTGTRITAMDRLPVEAGFVSYGILVLDLR